MSILVLQIIIKQWDKGQRSEQHLQARADMPDRYSILMPPAFYLFNKQIVIDQHGDDLLGGRINYSLSDDKQLTVDRFRICLTNKTLEYTGKPDSNTTPRLIGSLDNNWIQCRYDWRYRVFEGGFYYWLYEEITLNTICVDILSEDIFISSDPAIICSGLT